VDLIETNFRRLMAAALGTSYQPFYEDRKKARTTEELQELHQFDSMLASEETETYLDLAREWYMRIHGRVMLQALIGEQTAREVASAARDVHMQVPPKRFLDTLVAAVVDGPTAPLNDNELEYLRTYAESAVEVTSVRRQFVSKDVEYLDTMYGAGMMSDEDFARTKSSVHGVDLKPVPRERYFEGIMLASGQLPPREEMRLEVEKARRMSEVEITMQTRLARIVPAQPPGGGGGGGGGGGLRARPKPRSAERRSSQRKPVKRRRK